MVQFLLVKLAEKIVQTRKWIFDIIRMFLLKCELNFVIDIQEMCCVNAMSIRKLDWFGFGKFCRTQKYQWFLFSLAFNLTEKTNANDLWYWHEILPLIYAEIYERLVQCVTWSFLIFFND